MVDEERICLDYAAEMAYQSACSNRRSLDMTLAIAILRMVHSGHQSMRLHVCAVHDMPRYSCLGL